MTANGKRKGVNTFIAPQNKRYAGVFLFLFSACKCEAMNQPRIKDITDYLENIAPPSCQESYDNSGLLTGDPDDEVTGILVTLDCTEAVVEEAIGKGFNLIIAH